MQKITGTNSNLDSLVQLREFLVDNLVVNQKEKSEASKRTENPELNPITPVDAEPKTN